MMELQVGRLAATRQTWRSKTVRELVAEVITAHPGGSESQLRRAFCERLREEDDYFRAVADYAFDAAYRALTTQRERQAPTAAVRAQRAQKAADHAQQVASIKDQILLLNLEMPNGKRMRYCTGEEMGKFGAGYARIAKKVGKTAMVGSKLSEAEVRSLMT